MDTLTGPLIITIYFLLIFRQVILNFMVLVRDLIGVLVGVLVGVLIGDLAIFLLLVLSQ